jgi:hypothetical protein
VAVAEIRLSRTLSSIAPNTTREQIMPLFAFVVPLKPDKATAFRQFIADLNGPRKAEYEASRKNAGFRQEAVFLQRTPFGEMVVFVQDAETEQAALDALWGMTDSDHLSLLPSGMGARVLEDLAAPANELLLDYRC